MSELTRGNIKKIYKRLIKIRSMKKIKPIVENLKYHLINSTAVLAESHPFYSIYEVGLAGMTFETSVNARLTSTALAYFGFGWLYGKGRRLTRRALGINDNSPEKVQRRCDVGFNGLFNLALSPPIYIWCGARDWKEIAVGTGCAVVLGLINGAPTGYAIDAFEDLTGLRSNDRIPTALNRLADTLDKPSVIMPRLSYVADKLRNSAASIRKFKPRTKKGIAAGLVAVSIGAMALIYTINGYVRKNSEVPQQTISHVSTSPNLENKLSE
jgi:hypothetical protein